MPIQRTEAAWPVVYERIMGRLTPDDTRTALRYLVSLLERRKRCAMIVDFRAYEVLSHVSDPKGSQMKQERDERLQSMREVYAEHHEALRRYVAGVCYIIETGPLRAVLSGMLTALHPPYPTHIVGSISEAEAFCQAKLDEPPPRI